MISRLLLLIILPVMAYYLVQSISQRFNLTPRQNRIVFFITVALLVVGVLVVMGRLPIHFIFAPLGAAFAFMLRLLPTLLRLLPMWQMVKGRMSSARPRQDDQTSTIRTEYLAMELKHSTGDMDGVVLKGTQAKKQLSIMSLTELVELYKECIGDADSSQVLEAYIERNHPNWREETSTDTQSSGAADESVMTQTLALEILGLSDLEQNQVSADQAINKDRIIKAHRTLMQKMHPDRGGSDYLAKKINAAKDYLLQDV